MRYLTSIGLAILAFAFCSAALAQQRSIKMPAGVHKNVIHDVHVTGKVMSIGSASGSDSVKHMLVGVQLDTPLEGGGKTIEATVTHNEPPKKVQIQLAEHSGGVADVATVDITCPIVGVISYKGMTNAMGNNCTLNSYQL